MYCYRHFHNITIFRRYEVSSYMYILVNIYPKPQPRIGGVIRSVFKRRLIGLNSGFSVSKTSCPKVKEHSLPSYLSEAGGKIVWYICFPSVLELCEMLTTSSRNWTLVTVSISYDHNRYTTSAYFHMCMYMNIYDLYMCACGCVSEYVYVLWVPICQY